MTFFGHTVVTIMDSAYYRDPNTGRIIPPVPGVPRPVLKEKDFWAQGLNLGLEFRY